MKPGPRGHQLLEVPQIRTHHLLLEPVELLLNSKLAHDAYLVNLFSVAALAWVAYDMALNMNREISFVWRRWYERKGRHSRRLYVIVRYLSVVYLAWHVAVNTSVGLSLNFCRAWYYIVLICTTIITLIPDAMLLIRVNAVYNWNMCTLMFTGFLFMIQLTTSLVVGILAIGSSSTVSSALLSFSSSSLSPSLSFPFTPSTLSPAHTQYVQTITLQSSNPGVTQISGCPSVLSLPVARFTLLAWIPSILAQLAYFLLIVNALTHLMRGLDISRTKLLVKLETAPPSGPASGNEPARDPECGDILSNISKNVTSNPTRSHPHIPTTHNSPLVPFPTLPIGVSSPRSRSRARTLSFSHLNRDRTTNRTFPTSSTPAPDSTSLSFSSPELPLLRPQTSSHSNTHSHSSSTFQSDFSTNSVADVLYENFRLHRLSSLPYMPFPRPLPSGSASLSMLHSQSPSHCRSHSVSQSYIQVQHRSQSFSSLSMPASQNQSRVFPTYSSPILTAPPNTNVDDHSFSSSQFQPNLVGATTTAAGATVTVQSSVPTPTTLSPSHSARGTQRDTGTNETYHSFWYKCRAYLNVRLRPISRSLPTAISTKALFSWTAIVQVKRLVPTMMVFVTHGGWYCGFAILAKTVNAIFVTTASGPLQAAALPWMLAVYPVLVTRVYLDMVQHLHGPSKQRNPTLLASYDRDHYPAGFGRSEDYYDFDFLDEDDDDDGGDDTDGVDDGDGDTDLEVTSIRTNTRSRRSSRTAMQGRILDARAGQSETEAGNKESNGGRRKGKRRKRQREGRRGLGRITFAARESLRSPSMMDFRDEEF